MRRYSPRHSQKYFEFVEHTKPKRRRGRHVRVSERPIPFKLVTS